VPVASEVAEALDAPVDVIVVRKLGVPRQPELGMGAIGEGGVRVLNPEVVSQAGVSEEQIAVVEQRERVELTRRARRFRGDRPAIPLEGKTVVVVDDGIATGSTARAASQVCRAQGARRVVLAVPVAPPDWVARLADAADEFVCVETPDPFFAIGQFYMNFSQTTDAEVVGGLERSRQQPASAAVRQGDGPPRRDEPVEVQAGRLRLAGHLTVPEGSQAIVLFAHGSGSSRHSPRNRFVADVLNQAGLSTLLFDLLTPEEESARANVFDIDLLARRLIDVTAWLRTQPGIGDLAVGYFGASTGAAAALSAAAQPEAGVAAVVSRGGRPDLAGARLSDVMAPTLLIVGERDQAVLDLNRRAQAQLGGPNSLAIVAGATHLFEEAGTLEAAALLARDWFLGHLCPARG
jgi:putative phosphoribosyl transferase